MTTEDKKREIRDIISQLPPEGLLELLQRFTAVMADYKKQQ